MKMQVLTRQVWGWGEGGGGAEIAYLTSFQGSISVTMEMGYDLAHFSQCIRSFLRMCMPSSFLSPKPSTSHRAMLAGRANTYLQTKEAPLWQKLCQLLHEHSDSHMT